MGIKSLGHHSAKPVRRDIPDYSEITVDHLIKQLIRAGKGEQVQPGDTVKLRYTMWIYDPAAPGNHGRPLSGDHPQEKEITLGEHELIQGWETGLALMRAGEESILIIPPYLAYGEQSSNGEVPAGSIIQVQATVLATGKKARSQKTNRDPLSIRRNKQSQ